MQVFGLVTRVVLLLGTIGMIGQSGRSTDSTALWTECDLMCRSGFTRTIDSSMAQRDWLILQIDRSRHTLSAPIVARLAVMYWL